MRFTLSAMVIVLVASAAAVGASTTHAGGGCHNGAFSDERNTQVEMAGNCFEATVTRIEAGDQITWNNNDQEEHTVTGASESFGNYEPIGAGGSVSYQFDKTGVFPYFCVIHPSMVGAVVVGDGNPSSASDAGRAAKAVSADVSRGETDSSSEPVEETDDGSTNTWFVLGAGLVAVGAVAGLGLAVKRAVR